jgi:hypothetical protein
MWGFTVDDALISVRYARHLAAGFGWRFNVHGPVTDGVTPLPWPLLIAPLASADAWTVLTRVRAAGWAAAVLGGALLGNAIGQIDRAPAWARAAALATLLLSVPVAAHAVSGMETSLATLLSTGAAISYRRPLRAAAFAGLACALRPEMAPWAVTLAAGLSIAARWPPACVVGACGLALSPFVFCALLRDAIWGHPAPLALLAKPSSLAFGIPYAGAALVVSIVPILVLAPWALWRSPPAAAIVCAACAHAGAIAAVGGDWMPYARLWVPVVPSLALAATLAGEHATALATGSRSVAAILLGLLLLARGGTAGRLVGADREALIRQSRSRLEPLGRIASLDVGWVGAATEADVIDLAGVTDPEVAALPGGHTSKRVGALFLLSRSPGALLLYSATGLPRGRLDAWRDADFSRVVEARLARDDLIARHFEPEAWLPLGPRGAGYVLLRRTDNIDPSPAPR